MIPLKFISKINNVMNKIVIHCKDFQIKVLQFENNLDTLRCLKCLSALAFPKIIQELFCFSYIDKSLSSDGAYIFEEEYKRLVIL